MYGYAGKILRVNLTNKSTRTEAVPLDLLRSYIGGRGLSTWFLYQEVPPNTDPLSPENELIFMTGPFAGTIVPNSSRFSVTAKSPLTGLWASSDAGGTWGREMKLAGYDGIIFSGKAKEPVYVWICEDTVEIRSARHIIGEDTYRTDEIIRSETDEKAVVACIGPAGENLVKLASIVSCGKNARVAGRAGLGAVMGSKNLKAVAVRGTKKLEIADPERLEKSVKEVLPQIVKRSEGLGKYGTSVVVMPAHIAGDLPIRNWRQGVWENAANVSGEEMSKHILVGRYYCGQCAIGCGREVKISEGKYAGVEGAGPEYESIAALGSLCLIDDIKAIAKANELCNRYGLDTISTGSAIAFAMEAFEKKLLSEKDVDGLTLDWGNAEAAIQIIRMISEKEGIGKILGEGVRNAAMKIGGCAREFAIHVKGLELPMHDPRCEASLALGYGTANRGACHLEGFSHDVERFLRVPELGYESPMDPYAAEGKGELVAKMQNLMYVFDSLPICKFTLFYIEKPIAKLLDWLNAVVGWNLTVNEFLKIGERTFNLARLYNVLCGVTRKDDFLPARILVNKRKDRNEKTNLPHMGKMLSDYYNFRGWSEDGIPTQEKLKELNLPTELPLHLIRRIDT